MKGSIIESETKWTFCVLITTEIVKWVVMISAIYLSVWQYCVIAGYTIFVSTSTNVVGQFWGVFTAIMVGVSLIYWPLRYLAMKMRYKFDFIRDERWRPAILTYILSTAVPCFTLILVAGKTTGLNHPSPETITVLQMVVMGLVITEWMVKLQQEKFTFQLFTAMALDFFFAYDVIAFVMITSQFNQTTSVYVFETGWAYACFIFAVVAMVKYIPTQPLGHSKKNAFSTGHLVYIITSMVCNDIPFVVIRLATMIIFGFLISDMIFLLKNIFHVFFDSIQIGIIVYNRNHVGSEKQIKHEREFRHLEDVWCDEDDMVCRNRVSAAAAAVGAYTNRAMDMPQVN